ncbi:MAG: OmpA family protein [Bacteroidia bacterium]
MKLGFKLIISFLFIAQLGYGQQYDRGGNGPLKYKVYFDTSDFSLHEKYYQTLKEIAKIIKSKPGILFEVSGHTDTLGTKKYNYLLSVKRAEVVKDYLLTLGVSEKNLHIVGKGETEAMAYLGRYRPRACRRVEFKQILKVSGRLVDAKSGRAIKGKVLLNIPHKPMKNQEFITKSDGRFEFITAFRKKYYFFGFADGYLSAVDSIMAKMKEPGSSNVDITVRMTEAVITERMNFGEIYFYEGNHKVMPQSQESIQKIIDLMNNNPTIFIEIRGHVTQPGREKLPKHVIDDGYKLSFARAEAVYNELVKKGVSPARIKYRGMGSEEMEFPNASTAAENEANRRVEIVILNLK